MFDLDQEIDAWCRSIRPKGGKQMSSTAELKDHVYCEVERLSKDGLSQDRLFVLRQNASGMMRNCDWSTQRIGTSRPLSQTRGRKLPTA